MRGMARLVDHGNPAGRVEELIAPVQAHSIELVAWYGTWLSSDWTDLDTADEEDLSTVLAVELEADRRD